MATQRQNKFEGLCRLCTSVESNNLHIFGDEGEGRQIASKIRICLPIFVHREDTLPKVVCLPCVTKLESFYSFREACVKAEGTLEAFLKEEQNFPHEPEVCLEEGISAKAADSVNSEREEEERGGRRKEDRVRGRRKKKCNENPAEDGVKSFRRGKRRKTLGTSKDASSAQVLEVNGSNIRDESKGNSQDSDQLGELPIPLSPATDLSQVLFPQLGDLHPEDYLLIKEEKFLAGANWNMENLFPPSHEGGLSFIKEEVNSDVVGKDGGCLDLSGEMIGGIKTEMGSANIIMGQIRQFLPPVWDVFEKVLGESRNDGEETAIVTHRRYIVGKRAFPCALCGNCFLLSGAGNLMENGRSGGRSRSVGNRQIRDANERPYGCVRCGKRYFRRSDLVRHEKTHLDERPFVCRLCGKGFCRKEHAQRHMSLHVGEKPFQCEACLKLFTRKEHLARHKRCHHPEGIIKAEDVIKAEDTCFAAGEGEREDRASFEEVIEANKANMVSGNSTRLRLRNTAVKTARQKAQRDKAGTSDTVKGGPKKPYQCEICIRAFSRREHLVRHRRSHFREQLKAASLKMSAAKQSKQGDGEDILAPSTLADTIIDGLEDSEKTGHSCPYCTQTFSCKEQLDRHRSRMHPLAEAVSAMMPQSPGDEVQPEDYSNIPVSTSPRAAPSPSPSPPHLVSEQIPVQLMDNVPAAKQSYCCILCPQTFSRKENLERHLKSVHAGLKPYACSCCGKRFGRAEQCRRHENRHQRHQGRGAVIMEDDPSTAMASLDVMFNSGEGGNHFNEVSELKGSSIESVKDSDFALGVLNNARLGNGSGNVATTVEDQGEDNVLCKDFGSDKVKYPKLKGAAKVESSKQQSHRSKRNKSYTCQVCGSIFPKKKHLARHRATHVNDSIVYK